MDICKDLLVFNELTRSEIVLIRSLNRELIFQQRQSMDFENKNNRYLYYKCE